MIPPANNATITLGTTKTLTVRNPLTFTGTDSSSIAFGTGGTVAYTSNKLSAFAATTSSELAGVISDETGSGSLVFSTAPTLNNPTISNYQAYTASSAPTYTAGLVWYDSSTSALAYYNNTTNNILHIGQELQQQVRNSTGSTITKGSIVYISGATGQIGNITLAQANAYTSSQVIGVANQDIPNNTNGWVVTQGTITNFNTSGLTEGSPVYLSATTAGAFTSTEPALDPTNRYDTQTYTSSGYGTGVLTYVTGNPMFSVTDTNGTITVFKPPLFEIITRMRSP